MKKYFVGFLVLGVVAGGLLIYTITLGVAAKQDKKVYDKAQEIAEKLNNYVSDNGTIPDSLAAIDVKDIPKEISYEKKSDEIYEFCATYKTADEGYYSSDPATQLLSAASSRLVLGGAFDQEIDSDYTPSYLSIYGHKKGRDCQTIKPYTFSSSYDDYNGGGLGGFDVFGGAQAKARDTERETDIKSLHAQIEAYYAANGRYPSRTNMNDANWRATNMRGLDNESLIDPYGYEYTLTPVPGTYVYSYAVFASDGLTPCDNTSVDCAVYTLTATREDGTPYKKSNLN